MKSMIEVIQEDKDILVCRKPAGIPVQTAKFGQADMVSLLKNYRAGKKEVPEIYVVHRLDQPVEGVMVFAKNQKAAASLSKQIQQKGVDKYYYAVVEGLPKPTQGTLEDYLLRDGKSNTSKVVKATVQGAKKAILHYKVLKTNEAADKKGNVKQGVKTQDREEKLKQMTESGSIQEELTQRRTSLMEIHLETGRHHQIRVQMAHAGYALVGDKKYNPSDESVYMPIGLCSVRLTFHHPVTNKKLEFSIQPCGMAFAEFMNNVKNTRDFSQGMN